MYKFILKRKKVLGLSILGIIIIAIIASSFFSSEKLKESENKDRAVIIKSIAELNGTKSNLSLVGEVSSQNEVDIISQSAGVITSVNAKLGSYVPAGFVLAQIENSAQRGRLLQSEAVVETAEANLAKIKKGLRDEQIVVLQNTLSSEEDRLYESRKSLIDSLNSAFILSDDAIRNKVDQFIIDPQSPNPQLAFNTSDTQAEINIELGRLQIEKLLNSWRNEIIELEAKSSDLNKASDTAYKNTSSIASYLDQTAITINSLTANSVFSASDISTWKTSLTLARTNMSGALSTITSARDRLSSRESAYISAQKNLEIATTGERLEDILVVEANLKQAQGALQEAKSNLEKTLLRTPIAGTVIDLLINNGDFVNTFTKIGKVANESGLKVTTFISEKDVNQIQIGSKATISDLFLGTVTQISPALDPITRKIEVTIGINGDHNLINGQNVSVAIERKIDTNQPLSIPLSALKVGALKNFVFTVNEENILVAHEVTLGALLGDKIIIASGLDPDMNIVVDARGLREGDTVITEL